ncbi:uncharacterized protein LOC115363170 isoform X2 [Myripristis murdjan]|uniref:uncharacterized protein LOC115363170 isoform X2 n=1 Tax=Myripristis murdjan TaxID=586833 RepID=UPI001175E55B|nr:uncharacterized protein LOC115363170 isoform X2 [Myripristis murdjan]
MNATMLQLRAFVNERLSAAAVEIFGEFEKAIDLYKAEVTRSKEEVHNLRKQLDFLHDKSAVEPPVAHSTAVGEGHDSSLLQEKLLPSTPVEMGQESNFNLKAEVAGPSHANAAVENPDWNYCMFQTDPEVSQVKEEQEELGIDSQKQEAVFFSPDDVVSEQDQPEAEVTTELEPLSSDCSAVQSENSDDEDWTESKGAQRRLKTQKSKMARKYSVEDALKMISDGNSSDMEQLGEDDEEEEEPDWTPPASTEENP